MKHFKISLPATLAFLFVELTGCAAVVSVSEFDDGRTAGDGVLKTSAAIEDAEVHRYDIKPGNNQRDKLIIVSARVVYGITDKLDVGFSSWSGGVPLVSSSAFIKYNVLAQESTFASVKLAAAYSPYSGTGSSSSTEEVSKTASYYGVALSLPVSYHAQNISFYFSPRVIYSQFRQQYDYDKYAYIPSKTWEYGEHTTKYDKGLRYAFSAGLIASAHIITINPELTLIQTQNRFIPRWGVRLGF